MGARADKLLNAAVAQVRDSGLAHETIRMGTVTAVSSFGTVSVQRNDDVFPVVRLLGSYAPAVGDRVEIANTMGGWICLGPLVDFDTSWQYPTLNSPFTNYGGTYQVARFRKVANKVEVQGLVRLNSMSGASEVFTLPTNCRPPLTLIVPVGGDGNHPRINVYATGEFRMMDDTGSYASLTCEYSID